MTPNYTYDEAGNNVQTVEETKVNGVESTSTITHEFNEANELVSESVTVGDETLTTTFEAPSISTDDNGGTIVNYKGGSEVNEQITLNNEEQQNTEATETDPSTWLNDSSDTLNQTLFNYTNGIMKFSDGKVTSIEMALGDDNSDTMEYTYDGDKLTISGLDQTWVLTTDEDGCVTEATSEELNTTITFTYTTVTDITDFNRALTAYQPAEAFSTGTLQARIVNSVNYASESIEASES